MPSVIMPDVHQLFETWSTQTVFRNSSAANALLMFSAFTLRRLDRNDQVLWQASHQYLRRAIASHAVEVEKGVTSLNADAVFLSSIFIAYASVSGVQYLSPAAEDLTSSISWFAPWRGVRTINLEAMEHLNGPETSRLMNTERKNIYYNTETCQFQIVLSESNQFLLLLDGADEAKTDSDVQNAYIFSAYHLQETYSNEDGTNPFKLASSSEPRFAQLLREEDPRALTMLGYFLMVIRKMQNTWWLPNATVAMFESVMKYLPAEWLPRMDWAVK